MMNSNQFPKWYGRKKFSGILSLLLMALSLTWSSQAQVAIDLSQYQKNSSIAVSAPDRDTLRVTWPVAKATQGEMVLDLRPDQPLIASLGLTEAGHKPGIIGTRLDPVTTLTIGERDKQKAAEAYQEMVFLKIPGNDLTKLMRSS